MNPSPLPAHCSPLQRELIDLEAHAIPDVTRDTTCAQCFSRLITEEEVDLAKEKLSTKSRRSAMGVDEIAYRALCRVSSPILVRVLNKSISERSIPSTWLRTILIALLKKGKDPVNPASYRIVASESCFLKLLTLILDWRLREWADQQHLLPPSQNGFRPGYLTPNNAHILRCAVDTARCAGRPLHAAFVDLTNAFPSVDRPSLWVKMYRQGAAGPIFDWIRNLYSRMSYSVRSDGIFSASFKSTLGILIGDPASPFAFLLYIADFVTPTDPDDVVLSGVPVGHLEHADDLVLLSLSAQGLQRKLVHLQTWAATNFMSGNPSKSCVLVFGAKPGLNAPTLFGAPIPFATSVRYVGISITSTHRNIFHDHADACAIKARSLANRALNLESVIGTLDPINGRKLYLSLIDPHLINGCEVTLDPAADILRPLQTVQHAYCRRIMGLGSPSLTTLLFTELGLWPIAWRRLDLALRYLAHIVNLHPDTLVHAATRASGTLALSNKPRGWYYQLRLAVLKKATYSLAPFAILSVAPFAILSVAHVTAARTALHNSLLRYLTDAHARSPKSYLVRPTVYPNGTRSIPVMAFRAYLRVSKTSRRNILVKLALSDHELALETLRRSDVSVLRCDRICRLCLVHIESPEHILFACKEIDIPSVSALRIALTRDALNGLQPSHVPPFPYDLLRHLLTRPDCVNDLADLAYHTYKYTIAFPIIGP